MGNIPAGDPHPDGKDDDSFEQSRDYRRQIPYPVLWIVGVLLVILLLVMVSKLSKQDINGGDAVIESG